MSRFSTTLAAQEAGDTIALITNDETLTWLELADRVGIRRSAIRGESGPAFVTAHPTVDAVAELFAAIESRRPIVPLHPRTTDEFRRRLVERTRAATLPAGTLACLATSGSTGEPKIAVLSQRAFEAAADASADRLGWRDDDRWLLALPFAHVGGLSVLLRCLAARRTIVLAEGDPFATIERHAVTIASLVPTQLARRDVFPCPPSLRILLLGGGAAAPALVTRWREAGWPLRLTYGLTEACSQVATQRGGGDDPTAGPPLRDVEIRNTPGGIIEVRGPTLLDGYLVDGSIVDPRDADGWLRTGDLGEIDSQGRLTVHGRADDVIVTGGEKASPAHIEAVLLSLPGIREACVFGRPDPQWGQVVAAVIVADPSAGGVDQILEASARALAPHERVRHVALVDRLPLLPNGKVDRRAVVAGVTDRLT